MAWVKSVEPHEATGQLKKVYEAAERRAGYVPHVTTVQSLRPDTLQRGLSLYRQLMDAPTGLSVRQRVLIATVVSQVNGCHYWMESHEGDLRAEVSSDEMARAIQHDYHTAGLGKAEVALLDYAVKLTMTPSAMTEKDVLVLRNHGFTDEHVVDAVHCIAYFNFINRVLDGLGVDPEAFMRYPTEQK